MQFSFPFKLNSLTLLVTFDYYSEPAEPEVGYKGCEEVGDIKIVIDEFDVYPHLQEDTRAEIEKECWKQIEREKVETVVENSR